MVENSDKYGSIGKELSDQMECKLCGAKVMRLYDEGICLMCKVKRTSNTSVLGKISGMGVIRKKRRKEDLRKIISAKKAIGKKKIKERK